jgi:hypothetical protein
MEWGRDMSFLITGFGRSGTTFLSEVLNQSPNWVRDGVSKFTDGME